MVAITMDPKGGMSPYLSGRIMTALGPSTSWEAEDLPSNYTREVACKEEAQRPRSS